MKKIKRTSLLFPLFLMLFLSLPVYICYSQIPMSQEDYKMLETSLLRAKELSKELKTLKNEKEILLSEKVKLLAEKESLLKEKNLSLQEKEKLLQEKEVLLAEKEKSIIEKEKSIAHLESLLMTASTSLEDISKDVIRLEVTNKVLKTTQGASIVVIAVLTVLYIFKK